MNTETVTAPKQKIVAIHKNADKDVREQLVDAFGLKIFFTDIAEWENYIIPRVNSLEDACRELGLDPAAHQYADRDSDDRSYAQGKIIVRALNGPFVLTWKDGNQRKWHAWMQYTEPGFRLFVVYCGYVSASATSGARLRLCSEKLAHHFAVTFEPTMRPFMDFE